MPVNKDDELHIGVDIGKASDDKTALMIQVGQKAYHFTGEEADAILQLIHAREEAHSRTMSAVELAKLFHDIYEQLSPSFGYETRKDTRHLDLDSPNGKLMVATCEEVLKQVRINETNIICGCPMCEYHVTASGLQSQLKENKEE